MRVRFGEDALTGWFYLNLEEHSGIIANLCLLANRFSQVRGVCWQGSWEIRSEFARRSRRQRKGVSLFTEHEKEPEEQNKRLLVIYYSIYQVGRVSCLGSHRSYTRNGHPERSTFRYLVEEPPLVNQFENTWSAGTSYDTGQSCLLLNMSTTTSIFLRLEHFLWQSSSPFSLRSHLCILHITISVQGLPQKLQVITVSNHILICWKFLALGCGKQDLKGPGVSIRRRGIKLLSLFRT